MAKLISRRAFARFAGGAGLGGTVLLETMLTEVQQKGILSRDTVKILLEVNDLADLQLNDDELDKVRNSLERSLESIRKIRAYQVRQSLEPATVFVVLR